LENPLKKIYYYEITKLIGMVNDRRGFWKGFCKSDEISGKNPEVDEQIWKIVETRYYYGTPTHQLILPQFWIFIYLICPKTSVINDFKGWTKTDSRSFL
jgi:hypothetical protein